MNWSCTTARPHGATVPPAPAPGTTARAADRKTCEQPIRPGWGARPRRQRGLKAFRVHICNKGARPRQPLIAEPRNHADSLSAHRPYGDLCGRYGHPCRFKAF